MKTWSAHTPPSKNWKNPIFCIWHPILVPFFQSCLEIRNELVTVATYKQWFESYWWAEKNECLTSSNWTPDSFKVCLKNFLIMPCKWEGLSNLLSCLMPLMMRLFFLSELSISSILWALLWLFLKWKKKKNAESKPALLLNVGGVSDVIQEKFWFWPRWPHNQRCQQQRSSSPSNKQTRKIFFFWTGTQNNQFYKIFYVRGFAKMSTDELIKSSTFSWKNEFLWKDRLQMKKTPAWF